MSGEIAAIFLASSAESTMHAVSSATLEFGRGIVGDRYHSHKGTFSKKLEAKELGDWQVTLIEVEEIDNFNDSMRLALDYGDFRRNILTRQVSLNAFVDKQFKIGNVVLEGLRLCEPCAHLANLVSDKVLPALVGRAGLRARIVEGGTIKPGDSIETPAE